MRKILFLLLSFSFVAAHSQTAEEIIKKYTDNSGGIAAFEKIKSAHIKGVVTAQGMDLPLDVQLIPGKAIRIEVEVMGSKIISAYKDGKGWRQNPLAGSDTPTPLSGSELNELKVQASLINALMDYKAKGNKVELLGQDSTGGVKSYKIKMTNQEDGKTTTYFIKASDYTMLKSVSQREMMGQTMDVETVFSNVKEINGVKFYMNRVQTANGEELQSVAYESVELNVPIDEKIFNMP